MGKTDPVAFKIIDTDLTLPSASNFAGNSGNDQLTIAEVIDQNRTYQHFPDAHAIQQ